ncbi:MAG: DUF1549 domain-containing protein [Planctomycetaceae bacterium]|nr:DUF1549 domain-containing protein [Planctomycetaceae bacterium]
MTAPPVCGRTIFWSVLIATAFASIGQADEPAPVAVPLHARIDQFVEADPGPIAPLASDEEFLRRISLDLTGLPPTPDEVRAFIADADGEKRTKTVDQLLADPRYARHMATVFDVMLMERRAASAVSDDEWKNYLVASFRQNKPYNVLAKELLSADGSDSATRPAARFFLDRAVEPNLLTRDVGRIFFGRDMQCAQCHDHPLIDDYKQADYQGLLAFMQGLSAFTAPAPDGKLYVAERIGSEIAFESVFVKGVKHATGPRIPGGVELVEPAFPPGEEYTIAPADGVRPIPKFSRRATLAETVTNGGNHWFNDNVANRLWMVLMGRGLVQPPDLHHSSNPPTNPALLRLLSDEFVRLGYDMRTFLREIALTKAYQRSIDLPLEASPGEIAAQRQQLAAQKAELEQVEEAQSAAHDAGVTAWQQAKEASAPSKAAVAAALAVATEADKTRATALAEFAKSKADLAAKQDVANAVAEASVKAQAAAAKLPQDVEFAAAVQKVNERNAQLAAEVAALAKAIEEKQSGVISAEVQVVVTRQGLDAARTNAAPLIEAIRVADEAMSAARKQKEAAATTLAAVENSEIAVGRLSEQVALAAEAANAVTALSASQAQLVASQQAAQQAASVMTQADAALAASKQQLDVVAQQRAVAEEEAAKRKTIADLLASAVSQATLAANETPGEASLTETVKLLQSKADEAAALAAATSSAVAVAVNAEQQATVAMTAADQARQAAAAELAPRSTAVEQAQTALTTAEAAVVSGRAAAEAAAAKVVEDRVSSFRAAALKPLTPEQLCFALLRVTGQYENFWKAEEAALIAAAPLPPEATSEQIAARRAEIEQKVYDKLKVHIPTFASIYAAGGGQPQGDFFATADQALFTANGGPILAWLGPGGGNLIERMNAQADPKLIAEDLYVTTLARRPSDTELAETAAYLAARPEEKLACVQELIWALLTSAEFRFNH